MPSESHPAKFVLGTLCGNKHDHENTGQSLRRLKKRRGKMVPGVCLICQREDRRRRYRENPEQAKCEARSWYRGNQERAVLTRKSYAESHKPELLEYSKGYRAENKDQIKAAKALDYRKNTEQFKAKSRAWYRDNRYQAKATRATWRWANLENVRAIGRAYSATPAGKEAARRASAKYRMRKTTQVGVVSLVYKEAMLEALKGTCPRCAVFMTTSSTLTCSSLTWDHVIPLSKGGRDDNGNLLPLCHSCNTSKGDRNIEEWLERPVSTVAEMRKGSHA